MGGGFPLPGGHLGDHGLQDRGHQALGGERGPRDQDRRRVTQATLELPRDPGRVGQPPPFGGLPDQQPLVGDPNRPRWGSPTTGSPG